MNLRVGNHQDIPVTVIRTERKKTASIKVIEGDVQVVVPNTLSDAGIQSLLNNKSSWIRQKLRIHQSIKPVIPKEYVSGESFAYLGKNYRLKLMQGSSTGVKLKGGYFVLSIPETYTGVARVEFIKSQLVSWYMNHADLRLKVKSDRYAEIIGVKPKSVGVKSYKSRWGGCSIHGDVNFNWRIIMAPHQIIDYVVVHELCHLRHHDHSAKFWKSVGSVIPDYLECREWLKVNAGVLAI